MDKPLSIEELALNKGDCLFVPGAELGLIKAAKEMTDEDGLQSWKDVLYHTADPDRFFAASQVLAKDLGEIVIGPDTRLSLDGWGNGYLGPVRSGLEVTILKRPRIISMLLMGTVGFSRYLNKARVYSSHKPGSQIICIGTEDQVKAECIGTGFIAEIVKGDFSPNRVFCHQCFSLETYKGIEMWITRIWVHER